MLPREPFNTLVRQGAADKTLRKVLEATKPQAVYLTEQDGDRGAIFVVEVEDSSAPSIQWPTSTAKSACSLEIDANVTT